MPNSHSIRAENAPEIYSAVVANFRRAYKEKFGSEATVLTDHEVLLCWEAGWYANEGENEDDISVEVMREKILEKGE